MDSANQEPTIATRLADWIVGLKFDELPEVVVARAKQCLLDQIGVQLRGVALPQVQPVLQLVQAMGGNAQATVAGQRFKTSVAYAAYANGTFGHSCEFDDSHFHCGHPGVCVIPAALAVAESQHRSGRELITAIVAGYQAQACGVGPVHQATLRLGWHGTKVGGVFGSAGAAAKLLGLDATRTAHALSIAASDASGTMEYDQSGGEVKRLHAGAPSRSGVQAALLAQLGMTGPLTIFEGKRGIYKLFGDGSPPQIDRFWDGRFHILETMFKLYPAVGTVHAALNALTDIMAGESFKVDDIELIKVGLADWAIPHGAAIVRPVDAIGAQFSLAFSVGLRVVEGRNELDSYLDAQRWSSPDILAVADKVKPHAITFAPGASQLGSTVEVVLRDGRSFEQHQASPRGFCDNPASDDDLLQKFLGLVDGRIAQAKANEIERCVRELESLDDTATLAELLAP